MNAVEDPVATTEEGRKSDEELRRLCATGPPPASLWRHYRTGRTYRVLATAVIEHSLEPVVVYRSPTGVVFTRPLSEWQQIIDGVPRFLPMRKLESMEARGFRCMPKRAR